MFKGKYFEILFFHILLVYDLLLISPTNYFLDTREMQAKVHKLLSCVAVAGKFKFKSELQNEGDHLLGANRLLDKQNCQTVCIV